jgi:hypothetical protein
MEANHDLAHPPEGLHTFLRTFSMSKARTGQATRRIR